MRVTRAALRDQVTQHVETDTADASSPLAERVPLAEVSANAATDVAALEEPEIKKMPAKKGKAKGSAKKGAKGKKGKASDEEQVEAGHVPEDERLAAASPTSEAPIDESTKEPTKEPSEGEEVDQVPVSDQPPPSPPSRPVRMTRRQLAIQEEELSKSQHAPLPSPPMLEETPEETTAGAQEQMPMPSSEEQVPAFQEEIVEVTSPETPVPEVEQVEHPEPAEVEQVANENPAEIEQVTTQEHKNVDQVVNKEPAGVEQIANQEPVEVDQVADQEPAEVEHVANQEPAEVEHVANREPTGAGQIVNQEPTQEESRIDAEVQQMSQPPDVTTPSVEVTSEPEPKTLTNAKSCEAGTTPATSRAPSRSPSKSPARSPRRLEESIEAIDALEEALDHVGRAIPKLEQSGDEKSPRKARFPRTAATPNARVKTTKKSPLASKVSMAPSVAPRSLKPTIARSSVARSSSVRLPSSKEHRKGSGEVSDYLASKRRPISMSFPTPPPPPKSSKQPTKPTFQLPGEAVAAKLKAQREERLKQEANGEVTKKRPRPISMPPPPKSTKPPTKPNFQLPGEVTAARLKAQKEERLKRETEGQAPTGRSFSMPPPPKTKSTKPPTKANFQLPGEAVAARLKAQREERLKREEEDAEGAKKPTFKARPVPVHKNTPALVRQTASSKARESMISKENTSSLTVPSSTRRASSVNVGKRSSVVAPRSISTSATTTSHRNSVVLPKSAVQPANATALKLKGRDVFNRDKLEKEAKDDQKRGKEEVAWKARAQAAERGRIASREWAEKQKRRSMALAAPKTEA
ncbi:hypothetical protein BDV95DRAFT_382310 [Massariosphaeria phaeospora]|uniref:Uncharacterized protein n=1 Tax=Massariosphaeria phaeospora TaxID=100035 RepID=A0A7C8M913_9PLEO|nr:hypothetical protein BDV95DRAFT_382310 [Massariosphaeria phaeospora]